MALDAEGLDAAAIAKRLHLPQKAVYVLRCEARRYARWKSTDMRLRLDPRDYKAIALQARLRGLRVEIFAGKLIAAIADDNLFDAVLDDGTCE